MAWYMTDSGLYNDEFISLPAKPIEKPYPKAMWRIEAATNNGIPFNELLPDIESIHIRPVKQPPYIIVYDVRTEQNSFKNHGVCILKPSECVETETLNGGWEVTLTHPIDSVGVWKYIVESNILKINEQLFIIRKIEQTFKGSSGNVKAYAEHIFYVLNEGWIFPGYTWQGKIKSVLNKFMDWNNERYSTKDTAYYFSASSDIDKNMPKQIEENGETIAEAILGESGLISKCEGFLYRDNFYFSINKEMEGAEKDTFDIRVGKDLTGIKRTVDLSSFVTYFRGCIDAADWFAIAWVWEKGNTQFAREIRQSKNFHFDSLDLEFDEQFELLKTDSIAYFNQHCKPLLSYEFDLQDLSQNPEYQEFTNLPRYKVGDTGKVYDERLGVSLSLPITKVRRNHITHRVEKVWIGNGQRTFTRPLFYNVDITELGKPEAVEFIGQLKDSELNNILDSNGNRILINLGV